MITQIGAAELADMFNLFIEEKDNRRVFRMVINLALSHKKIIVPWQRKSKPKAF